jgi:hypothetical protein
MLLIFSPPACAKATADRSSAPDIHRTVLLRSAFRPTKHPGEPGRNKAVASHRTPHGAATLQTSATHLICGVRLHGFGYAHHGAFTL